MNLPKSWQNSICSKCKFFHAYPSYNEHGEFWTWECYHSNDYSQDISKPKTSYCPGFLNGNYHV